MCSARRRGAISGRQLGRRGGRICERFALGRGNQIASAGADPRNEPRSARAGRDDPSRARQNPLIQPRHEISPHRIRDAWPAKAATALIGSAGRDRRHAPVLPHEISGRHHFCLILCILGVYSLSVHRGHTAINALVTSILDSPLCPSCQSRRAALVIPERDEVFVHRCLECGHRWATDAAAWRGGGASDEPALQCPH